MVGRIAYITGGNYCSDVVVFNYVCCQALVNNRVYSYIVSRGQTAIFSRRVWPRESKSYAYNLHKEAAVLDYRLINM